MLFWRAVQPRALHETFLLGYTGEIYVSPNNIYLAAPGCFVSTQNTSIHRVHITNGRTSHDVSGTIPDYVLNQFSMDEYEGYFKIATTRSDTTRFFEQSTSKNSVYILDAKLAPIGKIENLARTLCFLLCLHTSFQQRALIGEHLI